MSSPRKWHRELIAYARQIGIDDVRVEHKGRHPHIVGMFQGKPVNRAVANTPSDSRFARAKARRDLERAIGA